MTGRHQIPFATRGLLLHRFASSHHLSKIKCVFRCYISPSSTKVQQYTSTRLVVLCGAGAESLTPEISPPVLPSAPRGRQPCGSSASAEGRRPAPRACSTRCLPPVPAVDGALTSATKTSKAHKSSSCATWHSTPVGRAFRWDARRCGTFEAHVYDDIKTAPCHSHSRYYCSGFAQYTLSILARRGTIAASRLSASHHNVPPATAKGVAIGRPYCGIPRSSEDALTAREAEQRLTLRQP